jgi:hypothetical protein
MWPGLNFSRSNQTPPNNKRLILQAPVLHHVSPTGWVPERPHEETGRLDRRAPERLLEGMYMYMYMHIRADRWG